MADGANGEVGVDGHLFARHRVQCKACADLCHPACTLCNDHEVHDDQHREHYETDKQVSAHDEHGEALDDISRSIRPRMTLADDQFGRGHVQRQAKHQRGQKHTRKRRKVQRLLDKDTGCENQDGEGK